MNKKRYVLTAINAKYIHSNLAVYSLKAAAKAAGLDVELAEFTINHYIEFILQELYKKQPDVLFFSCYIWNWEYVKELAAECRKILPETPIWVGGPEVSYDAREVLKENPSITGVLLGEGEESFPGLLQVYEGLQGKSLGEVDGIAYRCDGCEVIQPLKNLPDLSKIPFPYENMEEFRHKIIYYESSRGCPFSCSYCLSSIDKRVRFRAMELVKQELGFFLEQKVPQVKFVDRTFNCKESHALEIWQFLLDHDNGVTNFHFEIGADLLTDRELELIGKMRPGLIQLEIGVQSTNPDTIREIRRTMDLVELKEKVQRVKGYGNTHQHLDLIAGLPYENLELFAKSFDEVFAMEPEQLQLGFLKVLKGSYMHEKALDYGIRYREKAPYEVLSTRWISYGELLRLKGVEAMVEIYYNSHQFAGTLRELLGEWSSAFTFFEALANYYTDKGLDQMQHARAKRYEILLDFIKETCPSCMKTKARVEEYRELLTFDYYLREYAKSRPAFAADISSYKEQIRELQKHYGKDKHVEVCHRPGTKEPEFWLFDYETRNPLTYDAEVRRVQLI